MTSQQRIQKLQALLPEWGVDALLITNPTDLFYLTSIKMSTGKLFVNKEGATLIVDGRYFEKCKEATMKTLLKSDESIASQFQRIERLGFDADTTTYAALIGLQTHGVECVPLERPVEKLRIVKDAQEQQKIRNACALVCKSFEYIAALLQEGVTEKQLAQHLQIFWLEQGADGAAFAPIIAFGENSAMPHHIHGNRALRRGDIVLIDIGVQLDAYCSDMTRVLFFGDPDPKLQEIAKIVKEAQVAALSRCRAGATTRQLDAVARSVIAKAGYEDLFVHGLGHGIGLEIHEAPYLKKESTSPDVLLEPGMAITIEPGIYISGLGGVRIEDTVIVTEQGCENLIPLQKYTHRE